MGLSAMAAMVVTLIRLLVLGALAYGITRLFGSDEPPAHRWLACEAGVLPWKPPSCDWWACACINRYASCPLVTARHRMLLAESDYALKPSPTFPLIDTFKERRDMWVFKRYVLPRCTGMTCCPAASDRPARASPRPGPVSGVPGRRIRRTRRTAAGAAARGYTLSAIP